MIGCGVVGQGIMRLLKENAASIEGRLGGSIEVRPIAAHDPNKERGPYVPMSPLTYDPEEVLSDPSV